MAGIGLSMMTQGAAQGLQDLRQRKRQDVQDQRTQEEHDSRIEGRQSRRSWDEELRNRERTIWDFEDLAREAEAERKKAAKEFAKADVMARQTEDPTHYADWYNKFVNDGNQVEIHRGENGQYQLVNYLSGKVQPIGSSIDEISDMGVALLDPEIYLYNRMENERIQAEGASQIESERIKQQGQTERSLIQRGGLRTGNDGRTFFVDPRTGTAKGIQTEGGEPLRAAPEGDEATALMKEAADVAAAFDIEKRDAYDMLLASKRKPRVEAIAEIAKILKDRYREKRTPEQLFADAEKVYDKFSDSGGRSGGLRTGGDDRGGAGASNDAGSQEDFSELWN